MIERRNHQERILQKKGIIYIICLTIAPYSLPLEVSCEMYVNCRFMFCASLSFSATSRSTGGKCTRNSIVDFGLVYKGDEEFAVCTKGMKIKIIRTNAVSKLSISIQKIGLNIL